ncbi:4'-phosphopantetheinyl transferase superfamily protein [Variovorax dokdonensis]|uniref:4'-phosphopantetheinyl transferase superfamily protein n=1 Tax=Variovorax dokdonensis TaxID=344883 RepID=A0ABT7NBQ6_9BURK|nr:4'-phosphopantetheinyl transferase superfamily protein [Variovorax dokdonensis]MDM0045305.1 4'-phosphopantetheinyl transferase superfamily protein [Variovorax dokdonensis]
MPNAHTEVWIVDIAQRADEGDRPPDELSWLMAGWLSASEWDGARGLRHPLIRRQHLMGRVLARTRLAHRLGVAPRRVSFASAPSGKPYALLDGAAISVHFNISHSGERVALALAECEVGIDIERRAPDIDAPALARRFFAPAEAQWIESGGPRISQRFGALWALKEACLKMQGAGLPGGLGGFTFQRTGFRHVRTVAVEAAEAPAAVPANWHCSLRALPDYWAAVCTLLPFAQSRWHQITAEALAVS